MAPLFFNLQFTVFDLHNYDDNGTSAFQKMTVRSALKLKFTLRFVFRYKHYGNY